MKQLPNIMVIAGEASGDQYGSRVLQAFRQRHPDAQFFGIGGDQLQAEGMELLFHIRDTAIMGFVEVIKRLRFIRNMFSTCEAAMKQRDPHALLLIDYPGFNLRLAKTAQKLGIKVIYYISPQVWAWGKNRTRKMNGLVDHLAVVLPFEQELFENEGLKVSFVGHPLLEILQPHERDSFFRHHGIPADRPLLALLPGSREQEVQRLLPVMLDAAEQIRERSGCSVAVGAARLPAALYDSCVEGHADIHLLRDSSHALMQHATAAVVTSGTATVETAWYQTPMVIVYRTSPLNYHIGKHLVNVDHIGMANILAGRTVVPELIQDDVTAENIARETLPYFLDASHRVDTIEALKDVKKSMGTPGASARVAAIMHDEVFG